MTGQSVSAASKGAGVQEQAPSTMASVPAVHLDQVRQVFSGGSNSVLPLTDSLSNCRDRPCVQAKRAGLRTRRVGV